MTIYELNNTNYLTTDCILAKRYQSSTNKAAIYMTDNRFNIALKKKKRDN